jgi:hypothetical protein
MRYEKNKIDFVPAESLKDCPAACRALDFLLCGTPPAATKGEPFVPRNDLGTLEALNHASELLRCAAATAYESADALKGGQRDLAFSVVHMITMARSMVDSSLDGHSR